jgi:hypothetical protein
VPLIRPRPSLGPSTTRRRARRLASASAPGRRSPPMKASPAPIITAAICASGARSPDAPTDPCAGITGVTPFAPAWPRSGDITSQRTPDAPRPARELQRHHQPPRVRQRSPDAAAMRQDQVALQGAVSGLRSGRGQFAEAGVDAVDRLRSCPAGCRNRRCLRRRRPPGVRRVDRPSARVDGRKLIAARPRRGSAKPIASWVRPLKMRLCSGVDAEPADTSSAGSFDIPDREIGGTRRPPASDSVRQGRARGRRGT